MDISGPGITRSREREIKLDRSNRLHAFINKINESIIRSDDPEKIYTEICQYAIEYASLSMACVCTEEPGSGRMTPAAHKGFNHRLSGFLPHADAGIDDLCCPVNSFIASGRTFVCNEGGAKICAFPFSEGSVRPVYQSCAAFPIVVHNFPVGAIWLFSNEQKYFGSDEVSILESLARNLSLALDAREQERKRRDTEDALWMAEKRYRSIVENASEGICQTTRDGQFLMANEALAKILGYASPVDLITGITNIGVEVYAEPERRDELLRLMDRDGVVRNFECRLHRKDGSLITVLVNTRAVRNEEGEFLYFEGTIRDITDRKFAFEALKAAKDEWVLTFDAVPDLIMIVDRNHCIQHANRALLDRISKKPEQVIGKRCHEFIHGTITPPVFCPHLRIINEGTPFEGEIYDDRLKGHFLLTVSPLLNNEGKVRGTVHVFREITERKRAEDELRKSEEKYRWLVENIGKEYFIYLHGTDGFFTYVSPSITGILGYLPSEFMSYYADYLTDNPINEKVVKYTELVMRGLRQEPYELEIYHKNGSRRILEVSEVPILDSHGAVVAVEGIAKDITESKRIAVCLQESEQRYRTLFEKAGEGIVYLSLNGNIVAVNDSFARMHGSTRDEMLAMTLADLDTPETLRLAPDRLQRIIAGEMLQFEVEHYHRDGHTISLDVSACMIVIGDEKLIVGFHRDITERKTADLKAKIMQSRLIHADKMKSLGMLVSSVAHEVNNPNNFIMFNSSILANAWKEIQEILDDYGREHGGFSLAGLSYTEMRDAIPRLISGINDGSHRIKNIVEKLREFARADRGSLDNEVDMKKVVQDAAMILQNEIKKHTDYFELSIDERVPAVRGNHQQLEQVIINLITNALHSLRDRAEGVEIGLGCDAAGDMLEVSVRDRGCGMSKDVVAKITDPFFTTRLDSGGTGLGLSISKAIIDDHRGTLEFLSEPDCGTTVIVKLPVTGTC